MTSIKTIKDVDENTWRAFKVMAARKGMNMGTFFKTMVEDYADEGGAAWNELLSRKPTITKQEGEKILKELSKERKRAGFRG